MHLDGRFGPRTSRVHDASGQEFFFSDCRADRINPLRAGSRGQIFGLLQPPGRLVYGLCATLGLDPRSLLLCQSPLCRWQRGARGSGQTHDTHSVEGRLSIMMSIITGSIRRKAKCGVWTLVSEADISQRSQPASDTASTGRNVPIPVPTRRCGCSQSSRKRAQRDAKDSTIADRNSKGPEPQRAFWGTFVSCRSDSARLRTKSTCQMLPAHQLALPMDRVDWCGGA